MSQHPTESFWSPRSVKTPNEEASKLEIEQSVPNVDPLIRFANSVRNRLDVLEDVLCSSQKSLTEFQAIAKINDLVDATQNMKATLTNLQEKYIDLQAKQNSYKTIITNMNRVKKNQQLLGSRLDMLEKKGKQDDGNDNGDADLSLASRINLLEEALFSVQAFEPNTQLTKEMKELSEKNKALEIKVKVLQKKLADTYANQIVLRVDLDNLDRRTSSKRKDLDSKGNKATTRVLSSKEKAVAVIPDKEDDNQEQSATKGPASPTQSSEK
ncbi:hypothetical protein MUCCIDRAFT_76143 [Mucor lusitanicus CBS 277.49]|uniref:Uncharacterized protein n=1 Tax=Mucor lusitanicus CBS 277.49 TaxID=747725 RepID=A0A163A0P6_MUCCL|nr:hypothetical protein MUCCIDRAFT_76143 [Mucor lusitanicus CBS 277.49]